MSKINALIKDGEWNMDPLLVPTSVPMGTDSTGRMLDTMMKGVNERNAWLQTPEGKVWLFNNDKAIYSSLAEKTLTKYNERFSANSMVPTMATLLRAQETFKHNDYLPASVFDPTHPTQMFSGKNAEKKEKSYWINFAYKDLVVYESNVQQLKTSITSMYDVLMETIHRHYNVIDGGSNAAHLLIGTLATNYHILSREYVSAGVYAPIFTIKELQNDPFCSPAIDLLYRCTQMIKSYNDGSETYVSFGGENMPTNLETPEFIDDLADSTMGWLFNKVKPNTKRFIPDYMKKTSAYTKDITEMVSITEFLWSLHWSKCGLKSESGLLDSGSDKTVGGLITRVENAKQTMRVLLPLAVALANTLTTAMNILTKESFYISKRLYDNYNAFLLAGEELNGKWYLAEIPHENQFIQSHDILSDILFLDENPVVLVSPLVQLSQQVFNNMSAILRIQLTSNRLSVYHPQINQMIEGIEPVLSSDGVNYVYPSINSEVEKAKLRNRELMAYADKRIQILDR